MESAAHFGVDKDARSTAYAGFSHNEINDLKGVG
jgi:hypothetical protein